MNAKDLENSYYKWLKQNLNFNDDSDGYISINTPFVDINFDNITLYAKPVQNKKTFILSDLGDTMFNLSMSGIAFKKNTKREEILNNILNNFGIKYDNNIFSIETDIDNFASAKTSLVQAIINAYDLTYLSRNNVVESFSEMFSDFLLQKKLTFSKDISIPINGNSVNANFNFLILRSSNSTEKFIKTINNNNNVNEVAKLFNYDVQRAQAYRKNSKFMLVINDTRNEVKSRSLELATDGLDKSKVHAYPYSKVINDDNILLA